MCFQMFLEGFYDLQPMTEVVSIFAEYQTAGHCVEVVS